MRIQRCGRFFVGILGLWMAAGCTATSPAPADGVLREKATQYVRLAAEHPDDPSVRAQAMEAIANTFGSEAGLLLREGLHDPHPAVRFAACMGLGRLAHTDAKSAVSPLVQDPQGSVRVAAYFALERMGDLSHRVAWRDALLYDPDPEVRRNAALALGQLRDGRVIPLLNKARADDGDDGVRLQALEALAFLGDEYAIQQFLVDAFGGLGFKQPFALLTLGHVPGDRVLAALRARLRHAPYLEAQLAAARSLGMQGHDDGFALALKSLTWDRPQEGLSDDPPSTQIMRVRSMAAMALGDIGRRDALRPLDQVMETDEDPRVQLAAATAILMIVNRSPLDSVGPGDVTRKPPDQDAAMPDFVG